MEPLPQEKPTAAWDQYWHEGRLASCGGEGGANYQPVITDGWREFFSKLADGTCMLDICTGNGAVARLAAESARARNVTVAIDAVDGATINPTGLGPGAEMIRFASRVPAENLPFPDASFDVLVGQYAIEYTDLERSLAELRRVSRPTANIRFVTHAANSVVVQGAGQQLADVERLLRTGIFETAVALVKASANGPATAARGVAHGHFLAALQRLHDASATTSDLLMYRNVGNVIVDAIQQQSRLGPGPILAKVLETASAIKAHQARVLAMRHAAFDAPAAQAFAARAERLWSKPVAFEPLVRADGALFGWVFAS